MACYSPIRAFRTPTGAVFNELSRHDIIGRLDLPCGQCIGCRMRRASDWELRIMHEASQYDANCFVTLTYSPGNLPADSSLEHRDFQLFMKRARRYFKTPIRFYMCGEYGDTTRRPHFHACLFNVDFRSDRVHAGKSASGYVFYTSALLDKLWGLGRAVVQDLTSETASYCARYIMKKQLGANAQYVNADGVCVAPEYSAMSLKPGIGSAWFAKYAGDVYPHDFVIQKGAERRPPRYYDDLMRKRDLLKYEVVEFARAKRAMAAHEDNTPERLRVRETVVKARADSFKRSL